LSLSILAIVLFSINITISRHKTSIFELYTVLQNGLNLYVCLTETKHKTTYTLAITSCGDTVGYQSFGRPCCHIL